jgi:insertion element IS1 protein InsB
MSRNKTTKPKPPSCPKCGDKSTIKSGSVDGEQRWKCKQCKYQYTRIKPRGRPLWQKSLAVFLYSYGISLHAIARIFDIQPSTVLKWVKTYAQDHVHTPELSNVKIMDSTDLANHFKDALNAGSPKLFISIDDSIFKENTGIAISQR